MVLHDLVAPALRSLIHVNTYTTLYILDAMVRTPPQIPQPRVEVSGILYPSFLLKIPSILFLKALKNRKI